MQVTRPEDMGVDTFIAELDQHEEFSFKAVDCVLTEYKLTELHDRLIEGRFIGVGRARLLQRLCLEHYGGSWRDTVNFYHRCTRSGEKRHYEDLITSILVMFGTLILYTAAKEGGASVGKSLVAWFRKHREANETDKTGVEDHVRNAAPLVNQLITQSILREVVRERQDASGNIQFTYERTIEYLEKRSLDPTSPAPSDAEELLRRLDTLLQKKGLPSDQAGEELLRAIAGKLKKQAEQELDHRS